MAEDPIELFRNMSNKRIECAYSCISIFEDFTEEEAKKMPHSVYDAWLNGKDLKGILYPKSTE